MTRAGRWLWRQGEQGSWGPLTRTHLVCVNWGLHQPLLDDACLRQDIVKVHGCLFGCRCAPGLLVGPSSLEALLPLLQAQDHDPAFRDLVLNVVRPGKTLMSEVRREGAPAADAAA